MEPFVQITTLLSYKMAIYCPNTSIFYILLYNLCLHTIYLHSVYIAIKLPALTIVLRSINTQAPNNCMSDVSQPMSPACGQVTNTTRPARDDVENINNISQVAKLPLINRWKPGQYGRDVLVSTQHERHQPETARSIKTVHIYAYSIGTLFLCIAFENYRNY